MTSERRAEVLQIEKVCGEKHTAINDRIGSLESWVSKIDGRIWLLVVTAMLQFASVAGVLLMMVVRAK